MYHLEKEQVYWPKMEKDIKEFINAKCHCLSQKKTQHIPHTPSGTTASSAQAIDFLKVGK